jgi:hypothetical protein
MKRLVPSLIITLVAAGIATTMLRSHTLSQVGKIAAPTLQEQQSADWVKRLPAQDFEDRSLVFPREPAR